MSSPYGTVLPGPGNFVSRAFHASAVLRNWLYIDGGELVYNSAESRTQEVLNQTIAIDLSKDWTNSSVVLHTIDRGQAPLLNNMAWWPTADEDALYTFGGALSYWAIEAKLLPNAPELWKFTPDHLGGGSWTEQSAGTSFPSNTPNTGAITYGNGTGYYLGGELDFGTYPAQAYDKGVALPGLIEFDTESKTWRNTSSTAVSQYGTASNGGAHFVPIFGPEGLVVFFGLVPPVPNSFANTTVQEPFATISVFEPESKMWFNQTASGPSVPDWRTHFCTTGVAGSNGTYEIYIHGGTSYIHTGALNYHNAPAAVKNETNLDAIHVLTLPSFTWHQIPYITISSRFQHTCEIPTVNNGNSQMLIVGGLNFETVELATQDQDNFTQGLGVFDLNDLSWSPSWKANAPPYKTPQSIRNYITAHGNAPSQWNSSQLEAAFKISRKVPSIPVHAQHGSNARAIAGGVVGTVGLLLLICGLVAWWLIRKRRARRRMATANFHDHGTASYNTKSELASNRGIYQLAANERHYELSTHQAWELDSKTKPVELHGETRYFR